MIYPYMIYFLVL